MPDESEKDLDAVQEYLIQKAIEKEDDIVKLAEMFNVSDQAMAIRLMVVQK